MKNMYPISMNLRDSLSKRKSDICDGALWVLPFKDFAYRVGNSPVCLLITWSMFLIIRDF